MKYEVDFLMIWNADGNLFLHKWILQKKKNGPVDRYWK